MVSEQASNAITLQMAAEKVDHVRCALSEALIAAGKPDIARETLMEIAQASGNPKARLRALNVFTILSAEQLHPAREGIAKLSEENDENIRDASRYSTVADRWEVHSGLTDLQVFVQSGKFQEADRGPANLSRAVGDLRSRRSAPDTLSQTER